MHDYLATLRRQFWKFILLSLVLGGGLGLYWLSQKKQSYLDGGFTISGETISKLRRQKMQLPQPVIDKLGEKAGQEVSLKEINSSIEDAYKQVYISIEKDRNQLKKQINEQARKSAHFRFTASQIDELKVESFHFPQDVFEQIADSLKKRPHPKNEAELFQSLKLNRVGQNLVEPIWLKRKRGGLDTCKNEQKNKVKADEGQKNTASLACAILQSFEPENSTGFDLSEEGLQKLSNHNVFLPTAADKHLRELLTTTVLVKSRVPPSNNVRKKTIPAVAEDGQEKFVERLNLEGLRAKIGDSLAWEVKERLAKTTHLPLVLVKLPEDVSKMTMPFPEAVLTLLACKDSGKECLQVKERVFGQTEFLKRLAKVSPQLSLENLAKSYGQDQAREILGKIVQQASNQGPSQLRTNQWSWTAIEEAIFDKNSGDFRAIYYLLVIAFTLAIALGFILMLTALIRFITHLPEGTDKTYVESLLEAIKRAAEGSNVSRLAAAGLITTTAAAGVGLGASALIANQSPSTPNPVDGRSMIYRTINNSRLPGDAGGNTSAGGATNVGGDTINNLPTLATADNEERLTAAIESLEKINSELTKLVGQRPQVTVFTERDSKVGEMLRQNRQVLGELALIERYLAVQSTSDRNASYNALAGQLANEREQFVTWLDVERRQMREQQNKERQEAGTNLNVRTTALTEQINENRTQTAQEIKNSVAQISKAGQFQADLTRLRAQRDVVDKVKQFFGGTRVYMFTDKAVKELLNLKSIETLFGPGQCPPGVSLAGVDEKKLERLAWTPFIDFNRFVDALSNCGVTFTSDPKKLKRKEAEQISIVQVAILR